MSMALLKGELQARLTYLTDELNLLRGQLETMDRRYHREIHELITLRQGMYSEVCRTLAIIGLSEAK